MRVNRVNSKVLPMNAGFAAYFVDCPVRPFFAVDPVLPYL